MEATNTDYDVETINGGEDNCLSLHTVLDSIRVNLNQLAENCCDVQDKMNHLEMDCIDLLQPIGDIITLERTLKQLSEIELNYINTLQKTL